MASEFVGAQDFTVVDHRELSERGRIHGKLDEPNRAIAQTDIHAARVRATKHSSPEGASRIGLTRAEAESVQGRCSEVRERGEMPTDIVLVPPGVLPSLVVAAISGVSRKRKALFRGDNGIRGSIGEIR